MRKADDPKKQLKLGLKIVVEDIHTTERGFFGHVLGGRFEGKRPPYIKPVCYPVMTLSRGFEGSLLASLRLEVHFVGSRPAYQYG